MRILDLFAGAGGSAMGYHRAFPDAEIVGVDIVDQPRYPFEFIQADAMTFDLDGFDFIHASPPCQGYTTMSNRYRGRGGSADDWPLLIALTRQRISTAPAWVIENVVGARSAMRHPITLHGGMFGLDVHRPRLFETSFPIHVIPAPQVAEPIGVYGKLDGRRLWTRNDGTELRCARTLEQAQAAMGIDWMEWRELAEAIPPAYTHWIGTQFLSTLQGAVA